MEEENWYTLHKASVRGCLQPAGTIGALGEGDVHQVRTNLRHGAAEGSGVGTRRPAGGHQRGMEGTLESRQGQALGSGVSERQALGGVGGA